MEVRSRGGFYRIYDNAGREIAIFLGEQSLENAGLFLDALERRHLYQPAGACVLCAMPHRGRGKMTCTRCGGPVQYPEIPEPERGATR